MNCRKCYRLGLALLALILLSSLSSYASAEIIDDITVHSDANGEIDAVVKFTVPIQYLRHFPQGKSSVTSIYFNILGSVPADEWQDYESLRTPPSDIVQDITITTRDRGTGPKVLIHFYRPAEFTVKMGRNSQVLVIHIKPVLPLQKNEGKASGGTATPLAAIPVVALPSIATPAMVAPTVTLPPVSASAKAAPVAAAPVAAAPVAAAPVPEPVTPAPTAKQIAAAAAPVAPSGDVTLPNVVLAPSASKSIRLPLGGKDGLPPFPDVDQVSQSEDKKLSENPSLAERITQANNQAAKLMEKAGNALLSGQAFLAIESFNKVLDLPPNKYTQDAQLWIAIAREKSGQQDKAILEFNSFLKIYPDGRSASWVKARLDTIKQSQPALFMAKAKPAVVPVKIQNTEMKYTEFGSLSMYYYQGASQTDTTATVGTGQTQTPTSFSSTDQKSLMTNVNLMGRSYNNEYDNRLVFQGFSVANFLPGQKNNSRLGAAYYEMKDRIVDYSVKVGVQSGFGGGVMGRFSGISAGYGLTSDLRVNVVTGQLIDFSNDTKPVFFGSSLDFGTRSQLGGSVYFNTQRVSGLTDRKAVGGNLRYFEQGFSVMSMLDYDMQFKALNMLTVQGTLNSNSVNGTDFNFLLDRRRAPILDIRNAVNGTTTTIATLIQNGWTMDDLILLANQRTTISNLAQVGMTNRLNEKWNIGTDFTISKTAGMVASGTLIGGIAGLEGYVPATPSSGNAWTISERMTGMGVFRGRDVTNFNLSYTKAQLVTAEAFQVSNHSDFQEKWTVDTTFRLGHQSVSTGSKSNNISPTARVSYKVRNNLTADTQLGLDWGKISSTVLDSTYTTKYFREYISLGFRYDF
jgi:hypothetical protein